MFQSWKWKDTISIRNVCFKFKKAFSFRRTKSPWLTPWPGAIKAPGPTGDTAPRPPALTILPRTPQFFNSGDAAALKCLSNWGTVYIVYPKMIESDKRLQAPASICTCHITSFQLQHTHAMAFLAMWRLPATVNRCVQSWNFDTNFYQL